MSCARCASIRSLHARRSRSGAAMRAAISRARSARRQARISDQSFIDRLLELLDPGPQLDLPGPGAAVLAVDVQIALRDGLGGEHSVIAARGGPDIAARPRDAAVDDEMADMDVLGCELAGHALGEAA